ncbi:MAG: LPS export ABC transporter periplasmic protein LptC [Muribaculaceae bacterium]|nr:LPS export ABC transporter periplasmic protein LptC [Muribaculaceae bacterium]
MDHSNTSKVFLEEADSMVKHNNTDYISLYGNQRQVKFRHGNMYMSCDSAYFFDQENSFNAYGNIHMWSGDTLYIYADSLNYLGDEEHAILYAYDGNTVKLINHDVKLETDIFEYDLIEEIGFYTTGGVLTDKQNRLESIEGDYSPATKLANFYSNVYLCSNSKDNKKSEIFTESLHYSTFTKIANIDSDAVIMSDGNTINTYNADYNTVTKVARLMSESTITNKDGTIYTSNGDYNTNTQIANLYDHSSIRTKDNKTLEGDTLFYDRANGYGEAYGNMVLTDNEKLSKLKGDYGYYNEVIDSAFVTGHALAMEYSKGDTLYMHGDTIRGYRIIKEIVLNPKDSISTTTLDTTHFIVVNPRVRIYRSDIQGVCDSMTFRQQDSLLVMDKFPVLWSGHRQILGNVIEVHFNDSTADWARLPETGFASEHVEGEFYNQLSGKEMFATFENESLKKLNINGNVMAIYLPLENDSTYNKIVNLESSFLEAHFNEQNLEQCKIWSQSNGTVTPLYLAKKSLFYLPRFKWHESIRPKFPMDVFNVSPEMENMLRSTPSTTPQRRSKSN